MDYKRKYLKYKEKYLQYKYRSSLNQVGGDILSGAIMKFIGEFPELQNVAYNKEDNSFTKVDEQYLIRLKELASKQETFKNELKKLSYDDKQQREQDLKNMFEKLKNNNWTNFIKMKNEFYSIPDISDWVIEQYKSGNIKKVEDIQSRLKSAVDNFKWLQKKGYIGKDKKVTEFKGLVGLEEFLSTIGIQEKLVEKYKEQKGIIEAKEGGEIIYDGKDITIIHPTTKTGSCYYGKGTRWCTAATQSGNMFETYNIQGPLFIIQPKKPVRENEKYQLHFKTKQYMNENDDEVNLYDLYKKFSELEQLKERVPEIYSHLLSEYFSSSSSSSVLTIGDIKLLLDKGANINVYNKENETLLFNVVQNNSPDAFKIVELLLNKGANVNVPGSYGLMPLHYAVKNNGPDAFKIVELLLNKGANVLGTKTETPLHYAVQNNGPDALKIVELLLNKGANVNVQVANRGTPLHDAVKNNSPYALKIVELLLKNGADVNLSYLNGTTTPLCNAVKNENSDALKIVELLLNKGANVNVHDDPYKQTPLHDVVRNKGPNALKFVELLLNKGANVNIYNKENETPLHYAVMNNGPDSFKIVELLLNKGAIVDVYSKYSILPLFNAVTNNGPDALKIVELLLNKGANVNSYNKDNRTALHNAVQNNGPDALKIVELLLNKGANVNVSDDNDITPLRIAKGSEIKDLLKQKGAKKYL